MSKSLEESLIEGFEKKFNKSIGINYKCVVADMKDVEEYLNSSLAQYKREIIKEIKDDCFEVLFTKYLEHDDAVNATDDVLAELEKLNHTDKKEGGK